MRVSQPAFTWSRPADVGAGVACYNVYWGKPPAGTTTISTTLAAGYNAPAAAGMGTYYLRLQPLDRAGNRGAWRTAFVFRYDPDASACPVVREVNQVVNGVWQRAVSRPNIHLAPWK